MSTSLSTLRRFARAIRLVFGMAPRLALASTGLLLLDALLPLANLILLRQVVDSVAGAVRSGDPGLALPQLLGPAALAALVLALQAVARAAGTLVNEALAAELTDGVQALIHARSIQLDLATFEAPEYHDHLHRARRDGAHRPGRILHGLTQLAGGLLTAGATLGLVAALEPWLVVGLLAAAAPLLAWRLRRARELFLWRRGRTLTERLASVYDTMITSLPYAKELRLFDLGGHFQDQHRGLRATLKRERLALTRRRALGELAGQLAGLGVAAVALVVLGRRVLDGALSLGGLAMAAQALSRAGAAVRSAVTALAGLHEDSLYLASLEEFLELKPALTDPEQPRAWPLKLERGIAFEDVCFRYPGAEAPALFGASFEVRPGEIVAVVGPNGAGKSTLLKLLARLYDPERGRILIEREDVRGYRLRELRAALAFVCQDFVRYPASVRENIGFGDLRRLADVEAQAEAARRAGADALVERLPRGYETPLGRILEGGQELSAGHWQRLALARAYLRDAPILVFDEPASALDALAEADLVARLRALAEGRVALLISHRFSSVRLADRIVVLDQGRIVEQGRHETLLRGGGLYAKMYEAQAGLLARSESS